MRNATQTVTEKSMSEGADEVKAFYEPERDGVYDIAVSGDGTWRRRGFSSSYGVVTALSTVIGKALDCKVMSKECRLCVPWRGKDHLNLRTGGKVISMNAMRISPHRQEQWIQLVW